MTITPQNPGDSGARGVEFAETAVSVLVSAPRLVLLSGESGELRRTAGGAGDDATHVRWELDLGSAQAEGTDVWSPDGTLEREIVVRGPLGAGARLESSIELSDSPDGRFFVPGMVYSPEQWSAGVERSFADSRIAYPVVARWTPGDRRVISLARVDLATEDLGAEREKGQ